MRWMPIVAALLGAPLPRMAWAQTTLDPNVANYHADQAHSGRYTFPGLTPAVAGTAQLDAGFAATVNGHVYSQPLYWRPPGQAHGYVIVATMSNLVEARDAVTGALVWSRDLGPATPNSALPCGNLDPYGVASTPVIDEATGTVFVDGEILVDGTTPMHEVFGLSLADGHVLPGWPVAIDAALQAKGYTDFSSLEQGQRGALLFLGGHVYIAYGGHGLECGDYRGWVLDIHARKPFLADVWETTGVKAGIWSPGGVSYDGSHLYVTTDSTAAGTSTWSDGQAIIRLTPNVAHSTDPKTYFSPTFWQTLDQVDRGVGGDSVAILDVPSSGATPFRWVFQIDKNGDAFVADRDNLGGVGRGLLTLPGYLSTIVPPRTAPSVYPAPDGSGTFVTFAGVALNCPASSNPTYLTTMKVSASAVGLPVAATAWCASLPGALTVFPGHAPGAYADRGSPMITTTDGTGDPVVWELGTEGDEKLHAYDGVTGAVIFDGGPTAMGYINRFSTPLAVAAEDRIYVAADNALYSLIFPGIAGQ